MTRLKAIPILAWLIYFFFHQWQNLNYFQMISFKFINESEYVCYMCLHDLEKKLLQEKNLLATEMPQGEKLQYLTFLFKKKKYFTRWSGYFGENLVYLPV